MPAGVALPRQGLRPDLTPMQEAHLEDPVLRLAPEIHSATCPPPTADAPSMTDVWHTGTGSRARLAGRTLHAALAWQGRFLLMMGDSSPLQGRLHLHLVSDELRLLDSASLAAPAGNPQPGPLVLSHPDQIVFCFPSGGAVWRISLFPTFRLRLPRLSEPAGVHRRHAWRRHFGVAQID